MATSQLIQLFSTKGSEVSPAMTMFGRKRRTSHAVDGSLRSSAARVLAATTWSGLTSWKVPGAKSPTAIPETGPSGSRTSTSVISANSIGAAPSMSGNVIP